MKASVVLRKDDGTKLFAVSAEPVSMRILAFLSESAYDRSLGFYHLDPSFGRVEWSSQITCEITITDDNGDEVMMHGGLDQVIHILGVGAACNNDADIDGTRIYVSLEAALEDLEKATAAWNGEEHLPMLSHTVI